MDKSEYLMMELKHAKIEMMEAIRIEKIISNERIRRLKELGDNLIKQIENKQK